MSIELIGGLATAVHTSAHDASLDQISRNQRSLTPEEKDALRLEIVEANKESTKLYSITFGGVAACVALVIAFPALPVLGALGALAILGTVGTKAMALGDHAERLDERIIASEKNDAYLVERTEQNESRRLRKMKLDTSFNGASPRAAAASATPPENKLGAAVMDVIFGKRSGPA